MSRFLGKITPPLRSCENCKHLKLEYISQLNTEHIEGEHFRTYGISSNMSDEEKETIREEHRIPHHQMECPSGCCQIKIEMCQHEECFEYQGFAILGMPCSRRVRVKGQAQMNPYGRCKYYKRKLWKIKR